MDIAKLFIFKGMLQAGRRTEMAYEVWFDFTLQPIQLYGLAFLLGSYSVATLSDIKRMSAQSEFVSVWAIISIGLFVIDVYLVGTDKLALDMFAVKWAFIVVLSILCHERVGALFRLATGDVVALMATAALLSPVSIIIFYVLVKVVDLLTRPIWRSFGTESAYPFMPVIFLATVVVLGVSYFISQELG